MSDKPLSMYPTQKHSDHFFGDDEPLAIAGESFLAQQEMEKDIVLLIGAGDLSQEITRLARYAGFIAEVLDVDMRNTTHERFPAARQVILCDTYADISKRYAITPRHYLVVATQSFESDLEVLRLVLHSSARYIGVQGDEAKKEKLFATLRKEGTPAAELACICCPVGLPIGAEHPAEKAIAIIAELIASRSGCLAGGRSKKKSR